MSGAGPPSVPTGSRHWYQRWSRGKLLAVVAVIVVCVASIGVGGWVYLNRFPSGATVRSGTTTGLAALAMVEIGLPDPAGQSWTLFSDIGIASPTPFTPWVLGGDPNSSANQLATIWACGSLPLATVWNVSGLSSQLGNVSDGYAPFWQFMFVNQSSSGQLTFAIGSYSQGRVEVVGPLAQTSGCIEDLGLGPGIPMLGASRPNLETDVGGPLAYANAAWEFGPDFKPYALLWLDGLPMIANTGSDSFYSTGGIAWQASYYNCGLAGGVPPPDTVNSYHVSVWSQDGTPMVSGPVSVAFNCTLPKYELAGVLQQVSGGQDAASPQVGITVSGPFGEGIQTNVQGLGAWMMDPSLADRNQTSLAPTLDLCPTWVSDLASCPPPSGGWYAVLLSPSGQWLDSYGVVNGTPAWAAPNVPVLTNETFAILASTATNLTGATLRFLPQVAWPSISASPITL